MIDSKSYSNKRGYYKILLSVLLLFVVFSIIVKYVYVPIEIQLLVNIVMLVFLTLATLMIVLMKDDGNEKIKGIENTPSLKIKQIDDIKQEQKTNGIKNEVKPNGNYVADENIANEIKHTFLDSENRIRKELDNLKLRANVNLAIGGTITTVALFVLGIFISSENFDKVDNLKVLIHFLPRLSLVMFIELFALFFLRIYKLELLSMKYYHNELTNIESRKIATIISVRHCAQEKIWSTIEYLLKVERNSILKKDETNVELETLKLENKYSQNTLKATQGFLEKIIDKIPIVQKEK